jgi:hypothetical protein
MRSANALAVMYTHEGVYVHELMSSKLRVIPAGAADSAPSLHLFSSHNSVGTNSCRI